jgi:hypothetical protein
VEVKLLTATSSNKARDPGANKSPSMGFYIGDQQYAQGKYRYALQHMVNQMRHCVAFNFEA